MAVLQLGIAAVMHRDGAMLTIQGSGLLPHELLGLMYKKADCCNAEKTDCAMRV